MSNEIPIPCNIMYKLSLLLLINQLLDKKKRATVADISEDMECLCHLMKTVGSQLDVVKARVSTCLVFAKPLEWILFVVQEYSEILFRVQLIIICKSSLLLTSLSGLLFEYSSAFERDAFPGVLFIVLEFIFVFQPLLDQYFDRIQHIMEHTTLPSRIRFMLQDILELRKNKVTFSTSFFCVQLLYPACITYSVHINPAVLLKTANNSFSVQWIPRRAEQENAAPRPIQEIRQEAWQVKCMQCNLFLRQQPC